MKIAYNTHNCIRLTNSEFKIFQNTQWPFNFLSAKYRNEKFSLTGVGVVHIQNLQLGFLVENIM